MIGCTQDPDIINQECPKRLRKKWKNSEIKVFNKYKNTTNTKKQLIWPGHKIYHPAKERHLRITEKWSSMYRENDKNTQQVIMRR